MRKHIESECTQVPAIVKHQLRKSFTGPFRTQGEPDTNIDDPGMKAESGRSGSFRSARSASPCPSTASTSSLQSAGAAAVVRVGVKRKSMDRFVDITAPDEKARLDAAFARAVYATGLPLSTFEKTPWTEFFSALRPSYKVPTPYFLSGPLLDAEYAKCTAINKEKLEMASALGIMTDCYTNIRTESVLDVIVTTPTPILYKQVFRGTVREAGEYVADILISVIREVGPEKFVILVTDNASNMRAAWLLVTEEFPHITAFGCAAHCWNLLFGDIIQAISAVFRNYDKARKVVRYVKKSTNVSAVFSTKQKEKYGKSSITLKLPGKTRWAGAVMLYNSLLKNKAALQETVLHEDLVVDATIRRQVLEDAFWNRAKSINDLLVPIHAAITLIEGSKALLSDVYFLHRKIEDCVTSNLASLPITAQEKEHIMTLLAERKDFTIKAIHLAAYMLDPRFRGDRLSDGEVVEAIDYISCLAGRMGLDEGEIVANLGHFRSNEGFFSKKSIMDSAERLHPSVWWKGECSTQPLAKLASNLLSMPPSAADVERRWSDHGYIHNKSRNRLINERVTKLVTTRATLTTKEVTLSPLNVKDLVEYFDKYLTTLEA
ncbi:Zinc finger BED domain-containing protein 4 [Frankliniella fusca]|uniref:Zinc finger BED domain-containing protein 4 n=1 Tax=Frankliniella fusca TaxID=407009 RepID=A0AAE1GYU6_9NEOP|nr:Zinc finger BED domain-containing protein 4 [Frankliniella fusca]